MLSGPTGTVLGRASAHGNHTFAAGEPGDPRKPFRVVEILMTDGAGTMAYAPDRLEVKKGEQIKFVLKNVGAVDHEFLIDYSPTTPSTRRRWRRIPTWTTASPMPRA